MNEESASPIFSGVKIVDKRGKGSSVELPRREGAENLPPVEADAGGSLAGPQASIPPEIQALDPLMPGTKFWHGDILYEGVGIVPDVGLVIRPVQISREGMKKLRRSREQLPAMRSRTNSGTSE